jgi:hypothetical protein
MGKPTTSMAIFNSYVNKLPEGNSILAGVIPIFDSFGRQIDMFFTPDSRGLLPGEAMKPE